MYFLLHILFRFLSGVQNGLYYANNPSGYSILTIALSIQAIFTGVGTGNPITLYPFILTVIPIFWLYATFLFNWTKYIHTAESAVTGLYMASMSLISLPSAVFGMYPGLILHKMAVNYFSGLPILDDRTNDPTGRTYNIFIFNREYHIPRLSFRYRIPLAILSVIGYIYYMNKYQDIGLLDIIQYLLS